MPQHEQIGPDRIAQQRGGQAGGIYEGSPARPRLGPDPHLHIVRREFQVRIHGELPGD